MNENKRFIRRALMGGLAAACLLAAVLLLLNAVFQGPVSHFAFASHASIARFGSHAMAAGMEFACVFALGAAIGVATLPFADDTRPLLRRSLTHFVLTGALVLLCGWTFCFFDVEHGPLLLLAAYVLVYALVWGVRWLFWYAQLRQLRRALGLERRKPQ